MTPYEPDQGHLLAERDLGTPLIFVDRMPYGIVADVVLTDNSAWAEAATQHLIDRGHRRIAFLGEDRHPDREGTAIGTSAGHGEGDWWRRTI